METKGVLDRDRGLLVRLPVELHRRLKVACALEGRAIYRVVTELIEAWLRERESRS